MMNLNAVCVTGNESEERQRVRAAVYRLHYESFVKWDLRQIVPGDIVDSAQAALGPDHPAVADCCDLYGFIEWERQRYSGAAGCYAKALAIRERAFDTCHPGVADSLTNLGCLYATAIKKRGPQPMYGNWEMSPIYFRDERKVDAEPLFLRALEIRERAFGPGHPAVAAGLGNLAGLYANRGEFGRARPLAERALAIREQALGTEHPDVALSLANLALVLHGSGFKRKAESLDERVAAFWQRELDACGRAKANRRVRYFRSTRADELQPGQCFETAFPAWERARPEHPDLAAILVDFAEKWRHGEYRFGYVEVVAKDILKRAKAILDRTRLVDNPERDALRGRLDAVANYEDGAAKIKNLCSRVQACSHCGNVRWKNGSNDETEKR